jgi:enolase
MQNIKHKIYIRNVLMSTGEFTQEAVIENGQGKIYESAPQGVTLGKNEASLLTIGKGNDISFLNNKEVFNMSQAGFDELISSGLASQLTTSLSLAFLRYSSNKNGFTDDKLYEYIATTNKITPSFPHGIFNILNGGMHAGNRLEFCEFMIIPKAPSIDENIRIASEVYLDLKKILENDLGIEHTLVGREGGFAPNIPDVEYAILLIKKAINIRNGNVCDIAIDIAANNFSERVNGAHPGFKYYINNKKYSSYELVAYYESLLKKFPEITYLEDPFHEEDIDAWRELKNKIGSKILITGDDLIVTNIKYLEKYKDSINACILKINQVGTFTDLMKAYHFCMKNNIKTIISQRSGETDSDIISHVAIGLGSDYIKAGAPARERIIKYNSLLRIYDNK